MSGRMLHLSLPEDLAAEISAAVAQGEYLSESDAILGAVTEWRSQRLADGIGVDELRRLWREGLESGPGEGLSIDEIKAEARRRMTQE